MRLLPHEHGAYAQLAFPMVTAFLVAGVNTSAAMIATATIAAFLAHEPAVVVMGRRGQRAWRELQAQAITWLVGCAAMLAGAGVVGILTMPSHARWSLLVPLVSAALVALATITGRDKSAFGEIASAIAFSSAALPMALAGGVALDAAMSIAIPFALTFVAATLAVRLVILRTRGGGNARAASAMRRALFALVAIAAVALIWGSSVHVVPLTMLAAAAPGLVMATAIAALMPPATQLRTLGWIIVATSLVTMAIIVWATGSAMSPPPSAAAAG